MAYVGKNLRLTRVFQRHGRTPVVAMDHGFTLGRNIWQYKDPTAMTRAISKTIHKNATLEGAMKELK